LKDAGIAYGLVNTVAGLSVHPALRRCTVGSPTGSVEMPEPPARRDGKSTAPRPVPALGEHTEAVRKELAQ